MTRAAETSRTSAGPGPAPRPRSTRRPGRARFRAGDTLVVAGSRAVALLGVVALIGLLPWLSGRAPEYTVLRARYSELEPTEQNLAAVRTELGLDDGAWAVLRAWVSGVLQGDLGTSWVSNQPVGPGIVAALGVSLTLMLFAVLVALGTATLLCLPVLVRGLRGRPGAGSGVVATVLTSLPEFLLAAVLLVVVAVWWQLLPPFGWYGVRYAVLPALALGLPAGGLLGRLVSESIATTFDERWVRTWQGAGFGTGRLVGSVLRRALSPVLGQIGLVLIGLTGGAVAVEEVFAVPGLGRLTLGAASSLDLPALQAGVLALLLLAVLVGVVVSAVRRVLVGAALRSGALPAAPAQRQLRRRDLAVPLTALALLLAVVTTGLLRDPYAVAHPRLAPPSLLLPFGADASGRDLLARVGHGAVSTLGVALLVVLACLLIGLFLGSLPRLSTGPLEVTNAAPPIIAGLIVASIAGPSVEGAALAVTLVSWAPLAAHTGALVQEARARPHVQMLPVLGVSRTRVMLQHVLPSVIGPVARHAMLRLPGVALALAALGFLGLGPQPPLPEWGLLLSEGISYVERAPWTVLAPASTLVLAAVLAVAISSLARPARTARHHRSTAASAERSPAR